MLNIVEITLVSMGISLGILVIIFSLIDILMAYAEPDPGEKVLVGIWGLSIGVLILVSIILALVIGA